MPIYAYRCDDCGFAKDVLQKISDAPLTVCESCGKPSFRKQLSAPGFQLKGTGWYVTDFRNKGGSGSTAATGSSNSTSGGGSSGGGESSSAPASSTASSDV